MSVAFRRESDEEHKEPRFEIPILPGPNLLTARGLALTEARVSEFTAIVAQGGEAVAIEAAKRDLRYWSTRLAMAERAPTPNGEEVSFGTRVTIRLNGKTKVVDIVGDDEADPAGGSISFSAPLARALMGGEVGERLPFAGRADALEIVTIETLD